MLVVGSDVLVIINHHTTHTASLATQQAPCTSPLPAGTKNRFRLPSPSTNQKIFLELDALLKVIVASRKLRPAVG